MFFYKGEDWGSIISCTMAKLYPTRVKALHLTMPPLPKFTDPIFLYSLFLGSIAPSSLLTSQEIKNGISFTFSSFFTNYIKRTGYLHMQGLKIFLIYIHFKIFFLKFY